jgi:hypothetical protein
LGMRLTQAALNECVSNALGFFARGHDERAMRAREGLEVWVMGVVTEGQKPSIIVAKMSLRTRM